MKKLKLIPMAMFAFFAVLSCNSDNDNETLSCEDASQNVIEAANAYNNATADNYVALCHAYKDALQDQIDSCGDDTGVIQDMIDGLNCTAETGNGTISVNVGSAPMVFEDITVTTSGSTRTIHAEDNDSSMWLEFDLQNDVTGADKIENFNIHIASYDWTPWNDPDWGNWESNITVNSAAAINGTFHGYVASPDALNQQELTNGIIDIDL